MIQNHQTLGLLFALVPDNTWRMLGACARKKRSGLSLIVGDMMSEMTHEELWEAARKLPGDYAPYGELDRQTADKNGDFGPDCSWGCRYYHTLKGRRGMDWGVCGNPDSHRCGLLTYEHQGCPKFEPER